MKTISNFQDLISTPFQGTTNAIGWQRELQGDFAEIVNAISFDGNLLVVTIEMLQELNLSEQGTLAREILLNDLKLLTDFGASPILNIINYYERDDVLPFFPTDVYSFHVDRSPLPVDTFLCTYYGETSEIVKNAEAKQKVLIPEIRTKLLELYDGKDDASFEAFLTEYFFDLHYQANTDAEIIKLGMGHLWKIATDNPESSVLPCLHRAPKEKRGEKRLLLIC